MRGRYISSRPATVAAGAVLVLLLACTLGAALEGGAVKGLGWVAAIANGAERPGHQQALTATVTGGLTTSAQTNAPLSRSTLNSISTHNIPRTPTLCPRTQAPRPLLAPLLPAASCFRGRPWWARRPWP